VKAIGYLRVSTEEQAASGLGLEAQRARVTAEIERRGWELAEVIVDDGYSAKSMDRPGIIEAVRMLTSREADALVVAKLDRLSRSLLDFAALMDRSRREGWAVVALDLGVDTSTPSGEMMAGVMATFAQYERRLIAERTVAALRVLKSRGVRLGRPVALPAEVRERIAEEWARGTTLEVIAAGLTVDGVPTARGGRWHRATVLKVLRSLALDAEAFSYDRQYAEASRRLAVALDRQPAA
jgi:DNA invertase Pin-like site-specific DNA recombinase